VTYRFGRPDALSEPQSVPDSKDDCVSAVNWEGTVYVFLYGGSDRSIAYRTVRGKALGPVVDTGIRSTIPPGPAVDTIHRQLLLGTAGTLGKQTYRWQLRRLAWDPGTGRFKEVSCAFVGGDKAGWAGNRRPTLIFRANREYGPNGRIIWIAAGLAQPLTTPTRFYLAQTIGYRDVNDGWLLWGYYDEWTNTRSGIGAAWSTQQKDIVLATTWASSTAGGDCGTAVGDVDMGDFDDVSLMANYGLSRSISTFARLPVAETTNSGYASR
jgi:hypothetical protein